VVKLAVDAERENPLNSRRTQQLFVVSTFRKTDRACAVRLTTKR